MPGDRHIHSSNGRAAPAAVAAVAASRERGTPGTPSRKERPPRESSAVQDPGLKDYVRIMITPPRPFVQPTPLSRSRPRPQRPARPCETRCCHGKQPRLLLYENADSCVQRLGECLGKGAFGSVYKAFNWSTGEAVAVKQIKLADLPKSELRMIEVRSLLVQGGCQSHHVLTLLYRAKSICLRTYW